MSHVIEPNGVLGAIAETGLLSDARIAELNRTTSNGIELSDDDILDSVRSRGWLTAWQCEQIRNGRHAHLRFGEFVLTEFVLRDRSHRIFKAHSLEDDRCVALKVLTSQGQADPNAVARLKQDYEASRRVGSPWAIRCESIDEYQGRTCLIREWVDGQTLRSFVESHGRYDREKAVGLMLGIARGLKAIHAAGIRHGSVRADNVMLRLDGSPVWFDFGWSSEVGARGPVERTSVAYRQLEQATHSPEGDIATEAYFLGCVFYELLSGLPPHPELEKEQELQALMIRTFGSEIPLANISAPPRPEISRTVARMMQFRPEARLSDSEEIVKCFERIAQGLDPDSKAEKDGVSPDTAEMHAWLNGGEPAADADAQEGTHEEMPIVEDNRPIAMTPDKERNVLCVEAQEDIQRELRKTFDKFGWKSRLVRTTETAADMAREKPADIIVYDADGQGRDSLDAFLTLDKICSMGRTPARGLLLLGPKQLKFESTLPDSIRQRYEILRKPLKMRDVKSSLLACAIQN